MLSATQEWCTLLPSPQAFSISRLAYLRVHADGIVPVVGEVEEADVVLQTGRKLGQTSEGAVHHTVSPAAGAHRGADGQDPAP